MSKRPIVMVAIPTMGSVRTELENRLSEYTRDGDPSVHIVRISNVQDHAAARNSLVMYNFDPNVFTHMLFIDADMEPPQGFIEKMLAQNAPVVSGVSHCWGFGPNGHLAQPLDAIWKRRTQEDGTDTYDRIRLLHRLDFGLGTEENPEVISEYSRELENAAAACGIAFGTHPDEGPKTICELGIATGCFGMLIESWVFTALRQRFGYPYFKTEYLEETQEKAWSEDIWFCRNLETLGISITILPDLVFRHFKTVALSDIEAFGHRRWMDGFRAGFMHHAEQIRVIESIVTGVDKP